MDISLHSRKFHNHHVERTVDEIVHFVVYLGLGREFHACTIDRLFNILKRKDKYVNINKAKFEVLLTQVNERRDETGLWQVIVNFDEDIVKVR